MRIFKLRVLISPYFLLHYYLARDIRMVVKKYRIKGSIFDIGCGQKPYRRLFDKTQKYIGIDFPVYSKNKDFVGSRPDLLFNDKYLISNDMGIKHNTFDNVVSFQVIEHHPEPEVFIKNMAKVVKKNGIVIFSCPLIGGLHEEPNDYFRFTSYGLANLCNKAGLSLMEIMPEGTIFSSIITLVSYTINAFAARGVKYYVISLAIYPLFLVLQYLVFIIDLVLPSFKTPFNYLVVAKKV